jgi:hypothetical protein
MTRQCSIENNHWHYDDEPPPPSFPAKVKNALRDGSKVIWEAVKGGGFLIEGEEGERRLDICSGRNSHPICPLFNAKKGTCNHGKCGCKMDKTKIGIPGKVFFKHLKCPEEKW